MDFLVNWAVNQIEAGHMPDTVTRFGIRRLLQQRLRDLNTGSKAEQAERRERFLADAVAGPVAPVPEKANEQHYEVPPDFFRLSLGHRLKYSCCYWPVGVDSLNAAEDAALRETCNRAELADGMRILELGCGWGSLTLWMGEHYPNSQITAVSNSAPQRRHIEQQARLRRLDNVQVITADMNDFEPPERGYDRVVSIEMFEHMRNHKELLKRVASWLSPHGRLFVHVFCHREHLYPFESAGPQDWMAEHFFTGGMMPSENLFEHYNEHMKVQRHWRWNGNHYAKTCRAWLENTDAQRDVVIEIFRACYGQDAERWLERWRVFFMACEELFACNDGEEWFVGHYLFEPVNADSAPPGHH